MTTSSADPGAIRRWLTPRIAAGGRFALVGLLGIAVNQLLLFILVEVGHVYYLLAAVLASQGSTLFNFVGVETWVFRSRRASGIIRRFVAFDALNSTSLILRIPILFGLTSGLHLHYLVSNLVAIGVLTVVRFAISDSLIWSRKLPQVTLAP